MKNLQFLILTVTFASINEKLLAKHVFGNVRVLHLFGVIYHIQVDLFDAFKQLRLVKLRSDPNLKYIFHQVGTKWIHGLNRHIRVDLGDQRAFRANVDRAINLQFSHDSTQISYSFPDEDICLFRDFPHTQLVFPSFEFSTPVPCSCTLIWLVQYYALYASNNYVYYDTDTLQYNAVHFNLSVANVCFKQKQQTIGDLVQACDFERKFSNCVTMSMRSI